MAPSVDTVLVVLRPGGLRVEWAGAGRLHELEPAWADLAAAEPSPWATPAAFIAWRRAFAPDAELELCTVWRGERLDALLPLVQEPGRLRSATNDHTQQLTALARDRPALEGLFDAVLDRGQEIDLEPLIAPPGVRAALRRAAGRAGARMTVEPSLEAPFVDTSSGDFEAYRRSTRPSWMKRLARYRRQMDARYDLDLVPAAPPEDLDAELAAGFAVEARGWKGEAGTAIVSSDDTSRYYTEIAHAWHDHGELRLSRLSLDDRIVAFDLAVERARRLFSIKTGYDESFRKLVPGLVLRLSLVEACFERDIETHELLGGTYDWKRNFATGERGLLRVRLYPRRAAPLARWAWRTTVHPAFERLVPR